MGRELLEQEGFPKHALVCERHVGVGITKEEIVNNNLSLSVWDVLVVIILLLLAMHITSKINRYLVVRKVDIFFINR